MTAFTFFSPLAASRGTLALMEVCISKDAMVMCVWTYANYIVGHQPATSL